MQRAQPYQVGSVKGHGKGRVGTVPQVTTGIRRTVLPGPASAVKGPMQQRTGLQPLAVRAPPIVPARPRVLLATGAKIPLKSTIKPSTIKPSTIKTIGSTIKPSIIAKPNAIKPTLGAVAGKGSTGAVIRRTIPAPGHVKGGAPAVAAPLVRKPVPVAGVPATAVVAARKPIPTATSGIATWQGQVKRPLQAPASANSALVSAVDELYDACLKMGDEAKLQATWEKVKAARIKTFGPIPSVVAPAVVATKPASAIAVTKPAPAGKSSNLSRPEMQELLLTKIRDHLMEAEDYTLPMDTFGKDADIKQMKDELSGGTFTSFFSSFPENFEITGVKEGSSQYKVKLLNDDLTEALSRTVEYVGKAKRKPKFSQNK